MSGLATLNPKAESAKQDVALEVTVSAAMGVHNVIKSNLGPKGTLKMLVSGAGDIKLTKDGCVLLHEMAFQNPIASMIGKMATGWFFRSVRFRVEKGSNKGQNGVKKGSAMG